MDESECTIQPAGPEFNPTPYSIANALSPYMLGYGSIENRAGRWHPTNEKMTLSNTKTYPVWRIFRTTQRFSPNRLHTWRTPCGRLKVGLGWDLTNGVVDLKKMGITR